MNISSTFLNRWFSAATPRMLAAASRPRLRKQPCRLSLWLVSLTATGLLPLGGMRLTAQTAATWTGGTGNWSAGSLWSTGSAPNGAAYDVFIDGGKTTTASVVTMDGAYTVGRLTVDAGDTLSLTNILSVTNSGGFTGAGAIRNFGTINLFTPGTAGAFSVSGNVSLNGGGTVNFNGSSSISGSGTFTNVDNLIQGGDANGRGGFGNGTLTIVNQAAGTILANNSSLALYLRPGSGGLSNAGTLQASNNSTLILDNTGPFTNTGLISATAGGTVQVAGGSTLTNNGTLDAEAGSTLTVPAGALTNLSGGTLTGGRYVASSASAASPGTLSVGGSVVTNQASVELDGPGAVFNGLNALTTNGSNGALTINSGNTFTTGGALTNAGTINVSSSTFTVAGSLNNSGYVLANTSSSIVVQGNLVNSGKLATNVMGTTGTITVAGTLTQTATGTLYGAGSITASSFSLGGTLRPADYASNAATAGTLTLNGQVGLLSGTALIFDLGSTAASDEIRVNGSLTLAGTLTVRAMAGFGTGRYDLIDYTGTLTNNGLALGTLPAGYSYQIDTSIAGQVDLVVTAVPEPSTWAAVLAGGGFLGLVLRRRATRI